MGWSSATDIFDAAVDVALKHAPKEYTPTGKEIVNYGIVREIVKDAYDSIQLYDWDTQDESRYYEDHLIHVMYAKGEVDIECYVRHLNRDEASRCE